MIPPGIFRMIKTQLLVCSIGYANTNFCKLGRFCGNQFETQRLCVHDNETITTIGRIHREAPNPRNLKHHVGVTGKRRQVLHGYAMRFAITTRSSNPDQAPRRLENHFGHGFRHRYDPAV